MTQVYPGGTSTFLPNHEASGRLQVEFSRNPKDFALNNYTQIRGASQTTGKYLVIDTDEASRIINDDLRDYHWPDGADAPKGRAEKLEWLDFRTERYAFPFRLGKRSTEQATFDVVASHGRIHGQKAMTARARKTKATLTTAANWSGNTGTATSLGGGVWLGSTASTQRIRKTMNKVQQNILKSTGGVVRAEDMICVVDPLGASIIVESPEYQQYLVNHPQAVAAAQNSGIFDSFGLLPRLFGFNMVVDNTVVTTSKEGASSKTTEFLFSGIPTDNAVALFLSRPGGLFNPAAENAPSFSTLTCFVYEDMTVETKDDPDNRRIDGRIVDDYDVVLTAPASGYYVTNIDS